jgi:hypothetical protein
VLRNRNRTEGNTAVDDGYEDSDVTDDRYQPPADPRQIGDEGTILGGDALIWADQPSGVGLTAEPSAAKRMPTRRTYSWGQALILLAGAASLVFGVGAVALAGLAGPVTEPVVEVFTFDHTPLLGLIEIAAGTVLVLAGLVRGGRWVAGPVGVAAIVGGALVLAELDWTRTELAAERRFGWVPIIIGTAAYLGAMVPPKKRVTAIR